MNSVENWFACSPTKPPLRRDGGSVCPAKGGRRIERGLASPRPPTLRTAAGRTVRRHALSLTSRRGNGGLVGTATYSHLHRRVPAQIILPRPQLRLSTGGRWRNASRRDIMY